jgi:hypothetical protein
MDLIRYGAKTMFGGARRGNAPLAGLGALALGFGWIRRRYRADRELIYSRTLKKGEALQIRLRHADEPADGEAGDLEVT